MKAVTTLFLTLALTAIVLHLAMEEPGYVLLSFGTVSIEMPLIDFMLLSLLVMLLIYLLVRLLAWLFNAPGDLKKHQCKQQLSKSHRTLVQGMIEFAQGNWRNAEKLFTHSAKHSETPALNYLAAAHAAQRQNDTERRDNYLRTASKRDPKASLAIGLSQAELQLRFGQYEEALATLRHLEDIAPKQCLVKKMLAKLCFETEDWEGLGQLLPFLRKHPCLDEEKMLQMEIETAHAKFLQATQDNASDTVVNLESLWKKLPKNIQSQPEILATYAEQMIAANASEKIEPLLRKSLNNRWDEDLIRIYGDLQLQNNSKTISQLQKWQAEYPRSPELMLTAGRFAMQDQLWGKARSLITESIHRQPTAKAYEALAQLHERLDETEAALDAYRQGFLLLNQ